MKSSGPSSDPWGTPVFTVPQLDFFTVYLNSLLPITKPCFNPITHPTIYPVGLYFCQQSLVRHPVKRLAEIDIFPYSLNLYLLRH